MARTSSSKAKRRRIDSPVPSSYAALVRMRSTRRRDTACELELRRALHALGLRYRVDRRIPSSRRRADVIFSQARVIVFVDGCFWHGCPVHGTWPKANAAWWREKIETNIRRDRHTDDTLTKAGWKVLRFWEHDDPAAAARRVERVVRARKNRLGR